MFARIKTVKNKKYLQIVENKYIDGKVKQRVICSLGNLDKLREKGELDNIIKSLIKFSTKLELIESYRKGTKDIKVLSVKKVGPDLVLRRLWEELGLKEVFKGFYKRTNFSFDLERAIYFSVFQRLFNPSSDRREYELRRDYEIEGVSDLKLHQIYRAIEWLGRNKEMVEKELFSRKRDLFTSMNLIFIDTTSIHFEGSGRKSNLLDYGFSKARKPYKKQVIVNIAIDSNSRPILCDILKGSTPDIKVFLPTIEKIKRKFNIDNFCVIADRGMVSSKVIKELERRGVGYILGFRLRAQKKDFIERILKGFEVRELVKGRLFAKEVILDGQRYVLCLNEEEKEREKIMREQILEDLKIKLRQDIKKIIKNSSYKRYLKIEKDSVKIDRSKIKEDEVFDGVYCLITNTELPLKEVVLRYKDLWQIERVFRELKDTLKIRPVYHRVDFAIKGHIFCGFLGLVLMKELIKRLRDSELKISFERIRDDLSALYNVEILYKGNIYTLRSPFQGVAGRIFRVLRLRR